MKINFSFKQIGKKLYHDVNYIVIAFLVLFALWLLYFSYSHVYTTVLNPSPIDENTIISTRQKVDLELFEAIIDKSNEKKQSAKNFIIPTTTPFD